MGSSITYIALSVMITNIKSCSITLPNTSTTILTMQYGTIKGEQKSILNQGRVSAITEWGINQNTNPSALEIWTFVSDSQTEYDGKYGWGTKESCSPFTINTDDFIIGYGIYYDNTTIYGLTLYTINGFNYSCFDDSIISQKQYSMEKYSPDCIDNSTFYYLSGFIVSYGPGLNSIQFQFTKYSPQNYIRSFAITTANIDNSGTNTAILTLWFHKKIYQCSIEPVSISTNYSCNSSVWTVLPLPNSNNCSDYKVMIDNSNSSDTLIIDKIYVELMDHTYYAVDAFCVYGKPLSDGNDEYIHYNDRLSQRICGANTTWLDTMSISNNTQYLTGEQIAYFDMNYPNQFIENSELIAAVDEICDIRSGDYILVQRRFPRRKATLYCQDNYGTDLASIHNDYENEIVRELCRIYFDYCFIGLKVYDIDSNGVSANDTNISDYWAWSDGSELDYENWSDKTPGGKNDYPTDCTAIGAGNGKWREWWCVDPYYFVCNFHNPTSSPTRIPTMEPTIEPTYIDNYNTAYINVTPNPTLHSNSPSMIPTSAPVSKSAIDDSPLTGDVGSNLPLLLIIIGFAIVILISIAIYCGMKLQNWRTQSKTMYIKNAMVIIIGIGEYDDHLDENHEAKSGKKTLKDLKGIQIDIKNGVQLFGNKLRYKVFPCYGIVKYKAHWTRQELQEFLERKADSLENNLLQEKYEQRYDGLIVIVSCHGKGNYIITSDNKHMDKTDIHRIFSKKKYQSRKIPRMFIFDCCCGTREKFALSIDRSVSASIDEFNENPLRKHTKMETLDLDDTHKSGNKFDFHYNPDHVIVYGDQGKFGIESSSFGSGPSRTDGVRSASSLVWAKNEENPDYRLVIVNAANPGFQSKMDQHNGSYVITKFTERLIDNIGANSMFLNEILDDIQEELHDCGKQLMVHSFNNKTEYIKFKKNRTSDKGKLRRGPTVNLSVSVEMTDVGSKYVLLED